MARQLRGALLPSIFLCGVLLSTSQTARAGSIWIYTFSDKIGPWQNEQIGFSFSSPDPLQIVPDGYLVLHASDMDSYTIPPGDVFQLATLSWMWTGDFRVTFEYAAYPEPVDDKTFPIPSLASEGVYGDRITDIASLTIHDPVSTPEPTGSALIVMGLGLGSILWHLRRKLLLTSAADKMPMRASQSTKTEDMQA
jgi:hypothetical protein